MTADVSVLLWINQGWADPGLDFLFHWISQRAGFSTPLLLVLLLVLWRGFRFDGIKLWLLLLCGLALGDMLGNLLKGYFSMPRPCYELFEQLRALGGGMQYQCDAPATGMPSNHALNFFFAAAFLTYAPRIRSLSSSLYVVALLVGVSRIYLGKHYPSQVITGAVAGLLFGFLFAWMGLRVFGFGKTFLALKAGAGSFKLLSGDGRSPLKYLLQTGRGVEPAFSFIQPLVWLPLLLFVLTAGVIWLGQWNQPLFLWFNRLGPTSSDGLWANLTLLGDTLVVFALLGLTARHRADIVYAAFLAALLATLWVHGLKPLVDLPRPLAILGAEQVHVIGQALLSHSFPSGHSTTAFTLAAVIMFRGVHPLLALSVFILALLAGSSRAVVGAHWPLDILAGAFGGWLSAALGVWLAQRWPLQPRRPSHMAAVLLLGGCAAALLITRELGYPQAIGLQMLIGLVCLGYCLILLRDLLRERKASTPAS